ncbi:uncharacterized protein HMPREF1541_05063 [Cyphellophora europaea CBS 101466]|uniref:Beach-domain-containing protein n=1 Tax=Cyphellophora europaea (strain CBS 101466) TaxID=1220924 RepID=W2RYB4_CYPE1|nr:uncharacterized protein HMPREF1541_05063 [Cyphellophora europaea CBS 101466]ETN40783.1 hypothetical protein HMPREF1541_05063 [Cyphellophora europaea CBS 101466]
MSLAVSTQGRSRAISTAIVPEPRDGDISGLVDVLRVIDRSSYSALAHALEDSTVLQQLRHILKDDNDLHGSKGGFRRVGGHRVLLTSLKALTDLFTSQEVSPSENKRLLQNLSQLLGVLSASLEGHAGNQRFFRTGPNGNGWDEIESLATVLVKKIEQSTHQDLAVESFLGLLLVAATGEETVTDTYTSITKSQPVQGLESITEDTIAEIEDRVKAALAGATDLVLPEFLTIQVSAWRASQRAAPSMVHFSLPLSLKALISTTRHNLVNAHLVGLSSTLLPLLFSNDLPAQQRKLWKDVALLLYQEGASSLKEAGQLFSSARSKTDASLFLLDAIKNSRRPSSIQFDLSTSGYSSVELATLGASFPPTEAAGYTLSVWARFDEFDSTAHTTLFGAFDRSQSCFVLIYLEKDTHHLILQSSIRGSRPSVRFKAIVFEPGRWYHIGLVHRRPRATSSSKAFLFVDGEFVEQQKASYPSIPPSDRGQRLKVQAFFGTPHDLSPASSGGQCTSKWSLASAHLISDALSDDLIAVFYNLGPQYHGNFQDCLGGFQTYKASAALNLRNEMLHPGKEDNSELILAIRQKASDLIAEGRVLLSISPASVLDSDDRNHIDESQLVKSLSKLAAKNLVAYTRSGSNAVAINGAVPSINDALTQARGVAMLMGEPTVAVPQPLEDAAWRLGGCAPVGLGLVAQATTTEDLAVAVDILFETIRSSWRNSDVMERERGYEILAMLLGGKLSLNTDATKPVAILPTSALDRPGVFLKVLGSVLDFVGYDSHQKDQSVINNPMAYKTLLVDCSIWRCGPQAVQELYFEQFQIFAATSIHARFNLKRLARMRVLRRLLEALKSEPVSQTAVQAYMETFRVLLPQAVSAELLRSMALFVTYAVSKRHQDLPTRRGTRRSTRPRQSSNPSPSRHGEEPGTSLTHFEIGMEVLRLYSDVLCKDSDDFLIKRFAKTVTNKWVLYLMAETSPEIVVLSMRIMARLMVVHGDAYVKKLKDRSGGFEILAHRLKRWWHLPALWPCCFAILFGVDVAKLDLNRPFDLFGLVELFNGRKELSVVYPEMFRVITSMLQSGLKAIVSSKQHEKPTLSVPQEPVSGASTPQRLSMSTMAPPNPLLTIVTSQHVDTFGIVLSFLSDLHARSAKFREFAASSSYVQDLLGVLFPVVVGSDIVDASTELNARDSTLTFDGSDVVVQPLSSAPPIVRTSNVEAPQVNSRGKALRRGSSFVLVTKEVGRQNGSQSSLTQTVTPASPMAEPPELNDGSAIVQNLLEIIVAVFIDQIVARKDFPGLGLFLKTPPGFVEHQSYFESWILRNAVSQLSNYLSLNQQILAEPKVLTNLARLFSHFGEALFEGWFIGGAECLLDLSGSILEHLQRPDIAALKSVRLCSQAIGVIRAVVFRTVLLSLSQLQDEDSFAFLEKLSYWQTVLLSAEETQSTHLQLVCYLLYASLVSPRETVRNAAANLWRIILVQKPAEAAAILGYANTAEQKRLVASFEKLVELDNETFLYWIDEHRDELDLLFFDTLSKTWDHFVAEENKRTEEGARSRISRRREKLKMWAREEADEAELIRRHETTFEHWTANIYSAEHLKHQRLLQDHQDDLHFAETSFAKMQRDTARSSGVFPEEKPRKWRLDQTEGRNRMRMRLHEDHSKAQQDQQPKRKGTDTPALQLDTKNVKMSSLEAVAATPAPQSAVDSDVDGVREAFPDAPTNGDGSKPNDVDDSFELIEDPNEGQEDAEDKNRKVMRSLERGDQVKHVANISRILGLEAVEGLLILGKDHVYLMDNFFQRADGEIVNVWQAPQEERDSYIRMISGRDVTVRKATARDNEHEVRSWKWSEVISVSKRRFLFRDVAIEIFFGDGRSYLLTVVSPQARNDLHSLISARAPSFGSPDSPQSEFAWRYETLKSVDDEPQGFGSRFAHVFSQTAAMTATKKWQKGELSNFHYLMLVNTLAGRTYNDLTQYPVFPWVIADYTSAELDLNDPQTFRDLSKPMGCQTSTREAEFRDRYKTFAEMSDENTPPFHYGTHYSSAMIVTSYLIRLQPFVKSYLLLQGGTFDHPDRMFFSIEGTWKSASRMNMTDVRELTPEFFYLPEFLENLNDFDFGTRQNSSKSISSVELPPWAKGDPKIFISKNREALESPYVSKRLHQWIDLVFGFKQKGEAAIEAANVFHHLSYQGAKDLDAITDPVERLATIGIIHNFGQTPYQVFQRAHPAREQSRHKYKRLDTAAESLTRLPSTLLDSEERVASLCYAWKADKLLCSGPFRINMPPHYETYMEWGFSDNSVRFYSADSGKQIGLFEHLHIGQLSCAIFADSKTLITAGTDSTVAVWEIHHHGKVLNLLPKATLFGHREPATVLAMSRSFNALLSASKAGELMLWDLNRCEFVRRIDGNMEIQCACVNDVTGNIVLCHGSQISVYTINGDLLVRQESGDRSGEHIVSCACYEGAGNEWLERDIIFTGHKWGVVRIWNKVIHDGRFELELIRQLNHVDSSRGDGANVSSAISCILPMPQMVYTGDEDGRVCEWNCVQRQ